MVKKMMKGNLTRTAPSAKKTSNLTRTARSKAVSSEMGGGSRKRVAAPKHAKTHTSKVIKAQEGPTPRKQHSKAKRRK